MLKQMAALVALGAGRPEEFSDMAVAAMEDGADTPSLRLLAAGALQDCSDARQLARTVLSEAGVVVPSSKDAVLLLARETAAQIVDGAVAPSDGSRTIWRLTLLLPHERFPDLESFVYAASEWDDRPEDRNEFSRGIREAAGELVRGGAADGSAGASTA